MLAFFLTSLPGESLLTYLGEIAFKVKINTLFSRIVSAYCQKMGIASGSIRFHDDGGQRINEAQTIAEVWGVFLHNVYYSKVWEHKLMGLSFLVGP